MKKQTLLALALSLALPALSIAQDKAQPQGAPAADAMMDAWLKAAAPGDNHKILASLAGNWNTVQKTWMAPGQPPTESNGKARQTMTLGGRYLRQEFEGSFMGGPFSGEGVTAYDNLNKQFVSTWGDTLSTGIMVLTGNYDAATKTITLTGEITDIDGSKKPFKEVLRIVDADKHVLEMFDKVDGKDVRMMEITYTRAK
jgi:hypothetical protein